MPATGIEGMPPASGPEHIHMYIFLRVQVKQTIVLQDAPLYYKSPPGSIYLDAKHQFRLEPPLCIKRQSWETKPLCKYTNIAEKAAALFCTKQTNIATCSPVSTIKRGSSRAVLTWYAQIRDTFLHCKDWPFIYH